MSVIRPSLPQSEGPAGFTQNPSAAVFQLNLGTGMDVWSEDSASLQEGGRHLQIFFFKEPRVFFKGWFFEVSCAKARNAHHINSSLVSRDPVLYSRIFTRNKFSIGTIGALHRFLILTTCKCRNPKKQTREFSISFSHVLFPGVSSLIWHFPESLSDNYNPIRLVDTVEANWNVKDPNLFTWPRGWIWT